MEKIFHITTIRDLEEIIDLPAEEMKSMAGLMDRNVNVVFKPKKKGGLAKFVSHHSDSNEFKN